MSKVYINAIRASGNGYDVYTSHGVIENVHANVVRCAIGRDLDYLLKASIHGKELAFGLSESDLNDFRKHKA